jgi:hypothetical protein
VSAYAPKVAVLNRAGDHVRYVPAAAARALVSGGSAEAQASAGRVRAVSLVRTAEYCARRIGDPTGRATGVRFYRWVHLDKSASRIVEHHPRCTYD